VLSSERTDMHPGITVTGADESTALADLVSLLELSPRVEIGLLYTETPEGRPRYPNISWLARVTRVLGKRCAVHVCGQQARAATLSGRDWIGRAGRIQLNGNITPDEVRECLRTYRTYDVQVITQYQAGKRVEDVVTGDPRHSLLVDASGGRGISPETWVRPETDHPVGFAGGLGPDNLETELPRIRAVARDPWWIDMEGKLRTPDDYFDPNRARDAIETFLRLVESWEN
jgi:phosphoribosylanthranilate isomerase